MGNRYINSKLFHSKKLWVCASAIVAFVLLAFWVAQNLTGKAEGTLNNSPNQNIGAVHKISPPQTYQGPYLTLTYPGRYRPLGTKLTGRYLEVFALYSTDHSQISMTIGVLPETLSDDSSIAFRKQHPDIYKSVSVTSDRVIFESTTAAGYEKDEFIAHNNLVTSVVISAPYPEAIKGDLDSLINSFKWQ